MPALSDALGALKTQFPRVTDRPSTDHPAMDVPPEDCLAVLRRLRDFEAYDFLVDVTAVDEGEEASPRFTLVYHLFSTTALTYLRVATVCGDNDEPEAASATGLWPAADWHEREVFDMFGIRFSGHPDLRRILMWEGYPHHPLRKGFPLAGIETALPDLEVVAATGAKVLPAPMVGGPFVASSGEINLADAEPAAKDESWNESSAKPE